MNPSMTYEEFLKNVGNIILTEHGNCPVTPVTRDLVCKWKLQIIYELCIRSPMRFGELKKMLKPITNTMLANALKELEADGLVHRKQYNEIPAPRRIRPDRKRNRFVACFLRNFPVGDEIYPVNIRSFARYGT